LAISAIEKRTQVRNNSAFGYSGAIVMTDHRILSRMAIVHEELR